MKLEYFGQMNSHYWYETTDEYPFNVQLPADYKPPKDEEDDTYFDSLTLSPAGSILNQ